MSNGREILSALFDYCPSEWFDKRIGSQIPNRRIRSTIPRPRDVLASLRRRFSDQDLIAAGVAKPDAFDELQIVSALCQAGGAVMALRESPTEPPFDLMTGRGSLSRASHPVLSALLDSRTAALAEESGLMLAARRIQDVAVLDLINLPVTHGFGLSGMSISECRKIDTRYGEGLPTIMVSEPEHDQENVDENVDEIGVEGDSLWDPPAPNESVAFRPMLVLIDRLKHRAGDKPSNWLRNTAGWFANVRRHTGLLLAGVWIWQPDDDFNERMQFAYRLRDRAQIREVVLQSMTSLIDVESFEKSAGDQTEAGPSYLAARRALIQQLGVGVTVLATQGEQLTDSLQEYDSAVQREMAEPLIDWAQSQSNPAICVVGAQLAEVVSLLHRITPRLHALQMHRLAESSGGDDISLDSGLFQDHMRLLDRFSRLVGEIIKWMTA